jgi:RNA polymerase sigma factor (sigma-70 family)
MKSVPDLKLIEAAAKGDTEAIEQILLQYHPTITRFARKYCATPEDVEDAIQETLWIAAQKIGTLRVTSAFISWLFQVVRHQCFRLLKIARNESTLTVPAKLELADENPELRIALQNDVVNAIAHLSAEQRQVLIMRDIEGMTAPAVASTLGITLETVKSRLHRARNNLRQALKHWDE